jgi:DNA invertase Pin-like site-specific DNA recombinase
MKNVKAIGYIRFGTDAQRNGNRQREELHAKFGDTHEIVAEYRDHANGSKGVRSRPALKKLLEDAAKGEFDVLLCTDLTRLTRQVTAEIITAIREAGVKVVTADKGEVRDTDLLAQTLMHQSAKTYSELMSERIKRGKRASKAAAPKKQQTTKK